jgi:hypothetical protein
MMSLIFTAVYPTSKEHLWGRWSSEDGARVTPADLCDFTTPSEGPTGWTRNPVTAAGFS